LSSGSCSHPKVSNYYVDKKNDVTIKIFLYKFRNNHYEHVGQRDGHRFYKRVGVGSAGSAKLTRIIG
jgi:hypothetical protein